LGGGGGIGGGNRQKMEGRGGNVGGGCGNMTVLIKNQYLNEYLVYHTLILGGSMNHSMYAD